LRKHTARTLKKRGDAGLGTTLAKALSASVSAYQKKLKYMEIAQ
jgi:hypothetical protein